MTEAQAALFVAAWFIAMALVSLAGLSLIGRAHQPDLPACDQCGTPTDNGRHCRNCEGRR